VEDSKMNPLRQDPWIRKNPGPFKVGDRVAFPMVTRRVEGVIVEDRGNLGVGGRRIYAIRYRRDEWNELVTEMPVDELELVARAPAEGADGQAE
jgi:hypothetical protein